MFRRADWSELRYLRRRIRSWTLSAPSTFLGAEAEGPSRNPARLGDPLVETVTSLFKVDVADETPVSPKRPEDT